jgi:hypothetical protein
MGRFKLRVFAELCKDTRIYWELLVANPIPFAIFMNDNIKETLLAAKRALGFTEAFREFSDEWHDSGNPNAVEFRRLREDFFEKLALIEKHDS